MSHSTRRASVQQILESAISYAWTLDRFGVLVLSLSDTVELHVWGTEPPVPGDVRSHTSDRASTVIVGELTTSVWRPGVRTGSFFSRRLVDRETRRVAQGATDVVRLVASRAKRIGEAGRYHQRARVISAISALGGTVTLVERGSRTDREHMFWPKGEPCEVSGSRPATNAEAAAIATYALERWYGLSQEVADDPAAKPEPVVRPAGRQAPPMAAQCQCAANTPAVPADTRVDVLAAGLLEIEAGGPGGIVSWGATGMRDRARRALAEAGLLSPGAHRRASAETEYGLQSALGQ